jgi:catechol 2,3-dioxygenase-like lactoylglutathione lyase family enzyme
MIGHSRHVIAVHDLAASTAFYRDVLGCEVHEISDPGWRFFVRDHCHIMAGECPDALPPADLGDHSYFAYLEFDTVPALDGYFNSVVSRGAPIIKEIRNEPWGMREFAIRTIDGHRIMFGCEVNT